jgi:hypothetical protein
MEEENILMVAFEYLDTAIPEADTTAALCNYKVQRLY